MTDRERGFLDAIRADPSDDVVRLAFSDWLDDHGQPERGEFIRVQVELATYGCVPDGECGGCGMTRGKHIQGCLIEPLRRRERELLDAHWRDWSTPLTSGGPDDDVCTNLCDPDGRACSLFRRGFVANISLTLDDFLTHAKAVFGAAPVEDVRLTDRHAASEPDTRVRWWASVMAKAVPEPHFIPSALASHLKGDSRSGRVMSAERRSHLYPHRVAADADLSRACVAYGRDQAGLSALATKTEAVSR